MPYPYTHQEFKKSEDYLVEVTASTDMDNIYVTKCVKKTPWDSDFSNINYVQQDS